MSDTREERIVNAYNCECKAYGYTANHMVFEQICKDYGLTKKELSRILGDEI